MRELLLGSYRLLVDVEATRAYYADRPLPWLNCGCAGCRNFEKAVKLLSPEVKAFFSRLGLDPEKPAEVCWYQGTPATLSGDGWYHLCGRILAGAQPEGAYEVFGEWLPVTETFSAAFKTACDLLPENFPKPCFQMETQYLLPWVLEEPNPYEKG